MKKEVGRLAAAPRHMYNNVLDVRRLELGGGRWMRGGLINNSGGSGREGG